MTTDSNVEQRKFWNGPDVQHWIADQERYDRQLAPFADALFDAAKLSTSDRVLDVGCGTGATTLRAAASSASALGVDISQPMIERARARAQESGVENVEFDVGDAQVYPFKAASFDIVTSRFGVMFFEDPLAAFTNLASALQPGGRTTFACWQPLTNNDWLLIPAGAASQHLPLPPPNTGPGPFSLGDRDQLAALLANAGFDAVDIEPFVTDMLIAGGGTAEDALTFLLRTGMSRAMFGDAEPAAAQRARDAIRAALAEHVTDDGVRLGAAAWIVHAHARSS